MSQLLQTPRIIERHNLNLDLGRFQRCKTCGCKKMDCNDGTCGCNCPRAQRKSVFDLNILEDIEQ